MATESSLTKLVSKGSEETFENCCSPCFEDGISRDSKAFCMDCDMHYCEQCLKTHDKIPSLRGHKTTDKSGQVVGTPSGSVLAERCVAYHGKLIEMFCSDHDELCCQTCKVLQHRACRRVERIADVSVDIKGSNEYKKADTDVQEVLANLQAEKQKRQNNLSSLQDQRTKMFTEIDTCQDHLVNKIKELVRTSKDQIVSRETEHKKNIEHELESLETVISLLNACKKKLSGADDVQTFVNVKSAKKAAKDGKAILKEFVSSPEYNDLDIKLDLSLKEIIDKMNSFTYGTNIHARVNKYAAVFHTKCQIHTALTDITAVCILNDEKLIISDYRNNSLKWLHSTDFSVVETLSLAGEPFSMCAVGSEEIAVAIYSKKTVQTVYVRQSMSLGSSFVCNHPVYGVEFIPGNKQLFVSTEAKDVYVYDKNGTLLRKFEFPGQKAKNIAVMQGPTQQYILITDESEGLYAVNTTGTLIWKFTDGDLGRTWGVTVLPGNIILVSGYGSNNVFQLDQEGKKLGILVDVSEKLNQPLAMAFCRRTGRLIVGTTSDSIIVYNLSGQ